MLITRKWKSLFLLLFIVLLSLVVYERYPSIDDIDRFFDNYRADTPSDRRVKLMKSFVKRINMPPSIEKASIGEYALETRLYDLYSDT